MQGIPPVTRLRDRLAISVLALALTLAVPWSNLSAGTTPTYSIDFHHIGAAGGSMHGDCVRLSGTLGQTAPGYSSGSTNSVVAGFWVAAPSEDRNQLFFNGFEKGC